jgi:hypothetical protein
VTGILELVSAGEFKEEMFWFVEGVTKAVDLESEKY